MMNTVKNPCQDICSRHGFLFFEKILVKKSLDE